MTLSTPEGFLVNHDLKNKPSKGRLKSFLELCRAICDSIPPVYISVDNEGTHIEDFNYENLHSQGTEDDKYSEQVFSEKMLENLYDYYVKHMRS